MTILGALFPKIGVKMRHRWGLCPALAMSSEHWWGLIFHMRLPYPPDGHIAGPDRLPTCEGIGTTCGRFAVWAQPKLPQGRSPTPTCEGIETTLTLFKLPSGVLSG